MMENAGAVKRRKHKLVTSWDHESLYLLINLPGYFLPANIGEQVDLQAALRS